MDVAAQAEELDAEDDDREDEAAQRQGCRVGSLPEDTQHCGKARSSRVSLVNQSSGMLSCAATTGGRHPMLSLSQGQQQGQPQAPAEGAGEAPAAAVGVLGLPHREWDRWRGSFVSAEGTVEFGLLLRQQRPWWPAAGTALHAPRARPSRCKQHSCGRIATKRLPAPLRRTLTRMPSDSL